MSVKYRELDFKNEAERDKAVRYVVENAEFSLPGTRVVRVGRVPYRVSLYMLKGQYYLVHTPKEKEILMPRMWLITIPGFALCEVPISMGMEPCNKRVTGVFVDNGELVYTCDYHGSGFKAFRGIFDRQLKPVPKALCYRFCPQSSYVGKILAKKEFLRKGEKVEYFVELLMYECRAFLPYTDEKEEIKRRRPYRGMFILCIEDYWWRRYLRRHES